MAADTEPDGADPVQAGLEQFQRAALEAIRAGRAMLDAAETMVQDPRAAEHLVRTVTDVARSAGEAVAGFASRARPDRDRDADGEDPDDGDGGGVQHIPVG